VLASSMIWQTQARPSAKLPQNIEDAVLAAYPQATIRGHERGRVTLTVYEVRVEDGATRMEVTVAAPGTLVAVEREVARGELPVAVDQTLARLAGDAPIDEIERSEQRAQPGYAALARPKVVYEAEWRQNGREIEAAIEEDGTLSADDDESEDDDDDDDGDGDDDD
jgi:hypothetical protein